MHPAGQSWHRAIGLLVAAALTAGAASARPPLASPADLYGELYTRVEMEGLYADSKTFADATARAPAARIMSDYRAQRLPTRAALADFVSAHFTLPQDAALPPAGVAG